MRKEVKNLSFLWWVVLAGLIAPSFFSRMNNDPNKKSVAQVNGKTLDVAKFKRQYAMMQSERQMFNQRYGLNLDLSVDPALVIERGAEALLLDDVARSQNFVVDPAILSAMIRNSLSSLFGVNKEGFNVALYNHYIRQAGMTVRDFEEEQEATVRNSFVEDALHAAAYVPHLHGSSVSRKCKKTFAVLRFSKDAYAKHVKSDTDMSDDEVAAFFQIHKDNYRLPDIKRASYVVVDAHSYSKQVSITDEQIEVFYNRRKETLFKDKDHYRMRRLLIAVPQGASDEDVASFKKKADEFYAKIMANKDEFSEIAKTISDDSKTSKKGGMTEDFEFGAYHPEIEDALARLSNNGDVTPLVRTTEGFECAQLVHKKIGSYRTLDSVRKEISSTLTQRTANELLRGDIESLMRDAQGGGDIDLSGFAHDRHIKLEDTGEIEASSAQGGENVKSEVARKIFGSYAARPLLRGSFVFGDKQVVFSVTSSESDRYPTLDSVKPKVIGDMLKMASSDLMNKDVGSAQKAFFDEHIPLAEFAHSTKLATFFETGMLKKNDSIKGLEKEHAIAASLFKLDDPTMLSKTICHDGDIILASLLASDPYEETDSTENVDAGESIQVAEENLVSGFIASLKRNARIEISDDQFSSGS